MGSVTSMLAGSARDYPVPLNEAVREAEILRSGALFVGQDARLTALVERARDLFGTTMAALTIVHAQWQHVIAAVGTTPGTYRRSASFCAHAILDPTHVFCVPDASLDARFRETANVLGGDRIRFYAGAPIVSGRPPRGAGCVFDPAVRPCLDAAQETALRDLAGEAMTTIGDVARRRGGVG